jgi:hypothetical protein
MFLGLITLLTALVISSVAVYYSVSGLAAIFAGASIPIIIMGASLEVGKLVTASWLHRNWKTAPFVLKSYLAVATIILMFITSMGIFGFLSRAHIEQGAPVGDVAAVIEVINEKITAKRNEIEQAKTATKNLDDVVAQYLLKGKDEKSVAAANNARRNQQKERDKLAKDIDNAQKEISKLQEQRLPLTQQVRKIETEVGPIKYIAAFMYGNNPGQDLLEKAVTWMILTIIFVFDPLAVLLLIAGQMSLIQASDARNLKKEKQDEPTVIFVPEPIRAPEADIKVVVSEPVVNVEPVVHVVPVPEPPIVIEPIVEPVVIVEEPVQTEPVVVVKKIFRPDPPSVKEEVEPTPVKTRKKAAKKKEVVEEAPVTENVIEKIEYVQNSEQGENTLWQRVQRSRNIFKPMDVLYSEYSEHGFKDIDLSNQDQTDPEIQLLTKYVNDIKDNIIKFDDIPIEHREKLAELITRE